MAETKFESNIKTIYTQAEKVYLILSNFKNFDSVVGQTDKVKNWRSTEDSCRFTADMVGEIGLRIVEKEPFKVIKIGGDGKTPFEFFLWIQLKEVAPFDTKLKLTIKAELNMMTKMIVSKPLGNFINQLADQIAEGFNKNSPHFS